MTADNHATCLYNIVRTCTNHPHYDDDWIVSQRHQKFKLSHVKNFPDGVRKSLLLHICAKSEKSPITLFLTCDFFKGGGGGQLRKPPCIYNMTACIWRDNLSDDDEEDDFYLLACLLFPYGDVGTGLGGSPQELWRLCHWWSQQHIHVLPHSEVTNILLLMKDRLSLEVNFRWN